MIVLFGCLRLYLFNFLERYREGLKAPSSVVREKNCDGERVIGGERWCRNEGEKESWLCCKLMIPRLLHRSVYYPGLCTYSLVGLVCSETS